jgi:cation diffusion facilitator family transporter
VTAHAPAKNSSSDKHSPQTASPGPEPGESSHEGGSLRVVIAALAINVSIAAIKFIAAIVSRSAGMLAEALHSFADTANQIFLLVGFRLAARPPDEEHPFGYATESYFWAFIVALCIFAVGGSVSIVEGIQKIFHPHHQLENLGWAFAVLIASILLESYSFYVAIGEFQEIRKGRSVRRTLREARDPTVLTVMFEDLAALFGLGVATLGLVLTYFTGNALWDSLASVVVGLALVCVAFVLGRDAKSLLIGRSVPAVEQRRIAEIASGSPDVMNVIHIRTLHFGPKEAMCGLKLQFNPELDMHTLERRINELEARLRSEMPHLRRIYVEPGFDERQQPGRGETAG